MEAIADGRDRLLWRNAGLALFRTALDKGFLTGKISESAVFPGVDIRNSIRRFAPEAQKANRSEQRIAIDSDIGHDLCRFQFGCCSSTAARRTMLSRNVPGVAVALSPVNWSDSSLYQVTPLSYLKYNKLRSRETDSSVVTGKERTSMATQRQGGEILTTGNRLSCYSCALIVMCFAACLLSSQSLIAQEVVRRSVALPGPPAVRQPFILRAVTAHERGGT